MERSRPDLFDDTILVVPKQFNSILGETANKRNSPSLLDIQYNKLDLVTDSFNGDYINQPYIVRGIQQKGVTENERWGAPVAIADGLIRGGALTAANRTIADVRRIGKFMISAKGIGFITKQLGLHLTSQNQETDPVSAGLNLGFNPVKLYNPVAQLLSVAGNTVGQHFTRHGLIPILSNTKYENAVNYRNQNETSTFNTIVRGDSYQNRLLQLTKELLFPITDGYQLINKHDSITLRAFQARGKEQLLYKTYYDKKEIDRLSYLTGPGSVYGIGLTTINRSANSIPKDSFQLYSNKIHYAYGLAHDHPNSVIPIKLDSDPITSRPGAIRGNLQEFLRYAEESAEKKFLFIGEGIKNAGISEFNLVPMWSQMKSPFQRKLIDGYALDKRGSKTGYQHGYAKLNQVVPQDGYHQSVIIHQIQAYSTLDYLMIPRGTVKDTDPDATQKRKLFKNKIIDFRWGLGETDMVNEYPLQKNRTQALRAIFTNPKIVDFEKNNLTNRFGFGDHGKPGLYRDNPTRTHRSSVGINGEEVKNPRKFIGDRIQLIDFKREVDTENKDKIYELDGKNKYGFDGAEDLIEFYVTGPRRKDRAIVFRATINDIQDNFTPSYNTINYLGRADPIYLYSSFERSVSVSFQIAVTSRDELRSRWRSINALAAYTAPEYLANGRMRSPLMKLTLGHMFRQTPVFISNLSYTFDNSEITWETAKLEFDGIRTPQTSQEKEAFGLTGKDDPGGAGVLQLPKFINVRMELKIIGNYRPQLNGDSDGSPDMGIMYNLYDTNDGVLPTKEDGYVVNYFSDSVVVQVATDNQQPKQKITQTDVPTKKEGKKEITTTSPTRAANQPQELQYPYVNGDYVAIGYVFPSPYPPDVPAGYMLVKGANDLVPRYVSPSLMEAKPTAFILIETPEIALKSFRSDFKIQIYDLNN